MKNRKPILKFNGIIELMEIKIRKLKSEIIIEFDLTGIVGHKNCNCTFIN